MKARPVSLAIPQSDTSFCCKTADMQLVCYVSLFQRKVQTTEKYKKKYTKTANYVYKQNINIYYVVLAINLDMDSA